MTQAERTRTIIYVLVESSRWLAAQAKGHEENKNTGTQGKKKKKR